MKRVLIIGYVWPEPNSSAAGSRMMQLIRFFVGESYRVIFASPAQQSEHMSNLASLDVTLAEIELNNSSFDVFVAQLAPDIVVFDRFMMEEQFGWRVALQCPAALRILDTEDLHCLRNARHSALKQQRELSRDDLFSDIAKREVASILRCDLSLIISPVEMTLLQQTFNVDAALLHYCPFMFADDVFRQHCYAYEQRCDFISIGNFRHAPNWDAVLWLKQQIWPLIRTALPTARIRICGAYPPPKATDLHDMKAGFMVDGWVDDAIAAMSVARVCLAPLRFGAGIKGKLAEAMLCGTPSVTTEVGAEGMQTQNRWAGIIANDAQSIADAAVRLYNDQQLWQQASDIGHHNVKLLFDEHVHFALLRTKIITIIDTLTQHRQSNFTGAMLMHHYQKGTQYMAQWIESKTELAALKNTKAPD